MVTSIGKGFAEGYLDLSEIEQMLRQAFDAMQLTGKRVLVIIPDRTRTMPLPMVFSKFQQILGWRVKKLDYLVALGTHQPLDDAGLSKLIGCKVINGQAGTSRIFNHAWDKPETFTQPGTIPAEDISQLTAGLLGQEVAVQVNKNIFEYDQLILCGPVFPHEVAGFSGGNKYLFPGIAGPDMINFTHWLGALLTCSKIIGTAVTPVRAVIDRAASLIHIPTTCFAWVVDPGGVAGVYYGTALDAWAKAAELSAIRHIIYKPKAYAKVLSIMPAMYTDLWTAAKGMYKLEPVVVDGGEVIIFAPHIHEVSYTHGRLIDEIGYHCRDYFLAQWDKFQRYPGGVLAHSTHLNGLGKYNQSTGIESARIRVTLATGIPEERCERIRLGYLNPNSIELQMWQKREDEGILVVSNAGEVLYRMEERAEGG